MENLVSPSSDLAEVDDGWTLDDEPSPAMPAIEAASASMSSVPAAARLVTPIEDGFPLSRVELPAPALGAPLPPAAAAPRSKSAAVGAAPVPEPEAPIAAELLTHPADPASTEPDQDSRAGTGAIAAEASPAALALGTLDEEVAVAPDFSAPPVYWQADLRAPRRAAIPAAETGADHLERDGSFSEMDRAFFAEGEALESVEPDLDAYFDYVEDELSLWQRMWRGIVRSRSS